MVVRRFESSIAPAGFGRFSLTEFGTMRNDLEDQKRATERTTRNLGSGVPFFLIESNWLNVLPLKWRYGILMFVSAGIQDRMRSRKTSQ